MKRRGAQSSFRHVNSDRQAVSAIATPLYVTILGSDQLSEQKVLLARGRPGFARCVRCMWESMGVIKHRLLLIAPLKHMVFYCLVLTAQAYSASSKVPVRWAMSGRGRTVGESSEDCGTNLPVCANWFRDSGTVGTANGDVRMTIASGRRQVCSHKHRSNWG